MNCIGSRAVQRRLTFPSCILRELLCGEQDVVLVGLIEVSGGLRSVLRQFFLIFGRTVSDTSEWHGVGVLHMEVVALRENRAVGASITARCLRTLLAIAQSHVRSSCRYLPTGLQRYVLERCGLRRHSMVLLTII